MAWSVQRCRGRDRCPAEELVDSLMGKFLLVTGILLASLGALLLLGLPLWRLPGDIIYKRGHVTIYFPVVTSVLVSVVATLVMMWWRR